MGGPQVRPFFVSQKIKNPTTSCGAVDWGWNSGLKIISSDCMALKTVWRITHGRRLPVFARITVRIRLKSVHRTIVEGVPQYWGKCTAAKSSVTITIASGAPTARCNGE